MQVKYVSACKLNSSACNTLHKNPTLDRQILLRARTLFIPPSINYTRNYSLIRFGLMHSLSIVLFFKLIWNFCLTTDRYLKSIPITLNRSHPLSANQHHKHTIRTYDADKHGSLISCRSSMNSRNDIFKIRACSCLAQCLSLCLRRRRKKPILMLKLRFST